MWYSGIDEKSKLASVTTSNKDNDVKRFSCVTIRHENCHVCLCRHFRFSLFISCSFVMCVYANDSTTNQIFWPIETLQLVQQNVKFSIFSATEIQNDREMMFSSFIVHRSWSIILNSLLCESNQQVNLLKWYNFI